MNTQKRYAERLIHVREWHGETQQQLADAVGVTRQTLSRYELGERTAGIDILAAIAQHYGVSADYLLGLSDTPSISKDMQVACYTTRLPEATVTALQTLSKHDVEIVSKIICVMASDKSEFEIVHKNYVTAEEGRFLEGQA